MSDGEGVRRVLARAEGVRKSGREWRCTCPVHGGHSLCVAQGKKGAVVRCRAGCSIEDVLSSLGLDAAMLFDDWDAGGASVAPRVRKGSPSRRGAGAASDVATVAGLSRMFRLPEDALRAYGLRDRPGGVAVPYRDRDGSPLRGKIRKRLEGKPKYVYPKGDGKPRPYGLWRLPREVARAASRRDLVLVEGESDCWVLWTHNIPALGIPGADNTTVLEGGDLDGFGRLYVVQEPDEAGEKFVEGVGARCEELGWGGELRVVRLPVKDPAELHRRSAVAFRGEFGTCCSRSERFRSGGDLEDMLVSMDTVRPREVEYLWHPYLPVGKVTIAWGAPEAGKSFIVAAVASAVSTGSRLPGQVGVQPAGDVLLFAAEDDLEDTLRPRLDACGGDPSRVKAFDKRHRVHFDDRGFETIRRLIRHVRPRLVVFDPLVSYVGDRVNMIAQNEVRGALGPLIEIAENSSVAMLVVAHSSKDASKSGPLGSIDFTALPRSALLVVRDPSIPETEGLSGYLAHAKSSATVHGVTLRYTVGESGGLVWTGTSEMTARQVHGMLSDQARQAHGGKARQEAEAFLRRTLAGGEWVRASEVTEAALELGMNETTLWRARQGLHVEAERRGFQGPWWWRLVGAPPVDPELPLGDQVEAGGGDADDELPV